MAIVRQGPVAVPDQNVIVELVVVHARAAPVRIVLDPNDYSASSGTDQSPFGHLPVDRILIRPGVAEFPVIPLRYFKLGARAIGELIHVIVIVLGAITA